jgi:hypothetical protein
MHDRILPMMRNKTGMFQNVKPSSSFWKSGATGIWGVSVTYGVLKNTTFCQIWFFRHGYSKTSHAGYDVLLQHKEEIESAYPGLEFIWRKERQYPAVDISVSGVGYAVPATDEKLHEVVDLAVMMTKIVDKYKDAIVIAMKSTDEEKTSK